MATARNGDCSIHYEILGEGPPVVMLYGIGGDSRQWWEEFPRLLSASYRLILLDNRGTGLSDMPREPWTMLDMTGDVEAVVDDLGLESFHLAGCSLGSIIARHYVAQRGGHRLRSLSLLCPPNGIAATPEDLNAALFWDPEKPLIESATGSWPIVHPQPWVDKNLELLAARFEDSMRSPTPARTFRFQFQAAQDAEALAAANAALNRYDWPVLIMHGTVDRLVPFQNAEALKAEVPRARLEPLEGDSHNFWQHHPEVAADVLLDFLQSAEAARTAA
jgi:pimeloyl-ACP methyl ester carboxylesterase